MKIRPLWGVFLITSLACAEAPSSPSEPPLALTRSELARALVEAGAVRVSLERLVESFRGLAIARIEANVEALEKQLEQLPPDQRELARTRLDAMPARFEGDLGVFLESVDFDSLALEIYQPLYAEHFEVEELQAILRFYRSPAGQAFARANPRVGGAGTAELAARLEPSLETFMRQWFDRELQGLQSQLAPGGDGSERP